MNYALRSPTGPIELLPGQPIVSGDVQFSYDTMMLWSDAERAAHGIVGIVEPGPVPAGKVSTGSTLSDDGTTVRRVLTLVDAPAPAVPDNPTLGDWRVGLTLWGRMDDVTAKVAALVASSDPSQAILGKIATERLEYSNNVLRDQLLQLKDVFGFTAADVDESLWRAHQVSLGNLSGKWPLA